MLVVKRMLPLAALAAVLAVPAMPAWAQGSEKVLIVYGDDPCPTSGAGEEIVVCARKPERERYRIPEELRESRQSGASASWASKATSFEYVGKTGTDSCSPSGGGGWTGCYAELLRKAREERRQARAQRDEAP